MEPPYACSSSAKTRGIIGGVSSWPPLRYRVLTVCLLQYWLLILTFVATRAKLLTELRYCSFMLFGHCALVFLAGTATGFVESFIKSKGISNLTTWSKRVGGSIVVSVGVYLFYLGITF